MSVCPRLPYSGIRLSQIMVQRCLSVPDHGTAVSVCPRSWYSGVCLSQLMVRRCLSVPDHGTVVFPDHSTAMFVCLFQIMVQRCLSVPDHGTAVSVCSRSWYSGVCLFQIMVQRCLSAKNMTHVKAGSVFAAALKILPFFLWIIPGMISRILFPGKDSAS